MRPLTAALNLATLALASVSALSAPPAKQQGIAAGHGAFVDLATGKPFIPRGFTSVGILFPLPYVDDLCKTTSPGEKTQLTAAVRAMTDHTDQQLAAMKTQWHANTVRCQLSQGALVYEKQTGKHAYSDMASAVVRKARAAGLVVILSVQNEPRSCSPAWNGTKEGMRQADHLTEEAWSQIAPFLPLTDKGILLEVFNEPKTSFVCDKADWTYWATGCGKSPHEGMLIVGKFLRKLAPDNVLIFDGDFYGSRFSGFTPPPDMPTNSAFTVHPYGYAGGSSQWDDWFGNLQHSGHTVAVTEWNMAHGCPADKDPDGKMAEDFVLNYLPAHSIGMVAFSWDAPGEGRMVNPNTFAPIDHGRHCKQYTGASIVHTLFQRQSAAENQSR